MDRSKHYFSVELKSLQTTDEYVEIQGKASTISKDRDGDIVLPLAIDLTNYEKNPILLYQHNRGAPIGSATTIEKREDELYITGRVYKDMNKEAYVGIKNGVLKTFSIGFIGKDGKYDEESDTWFWTSVELLEISIVSIPSNQDAIFSAKHLEDKTLCGLSGKCNKSLQESKAFDEDKLKELVKESVKEALADLQEKGEKPSEEDTEEEQEVDTPPTEEEEVEDTDPQPTEEEVEQPSLLEVIDSVDNVNELYQAYLILEDKINQSLKQGE